MTTTTGTRAFEAMLAHHGALLDGVSGRIETLSSNVANGGRYEPFTADLVTYLAEEVLPHAAAEEHTIYSAASALGQLSETIAGMVDEHRRLAASIERLATAADADAATAEAAAIGSLFAAHVAKENDLVLPPPCRRRRGGPGRTAHRDAPPHRRRADRGLDRRRWGR